MPLEAEAGASGDAACAQPWAQARDVAISDEATSSGERRQASAASAKDGKAMPKRRTFVPARLLEKREDTISSHEPEWTWRA